MQLWMIERDVEGWSDDDLEAAGLRAKMCLGWYPDVFWVRSFHNRERSLVTCIYRATSEAALREHAQAAALPLTGIWQIEEILPDEIGTLSAEEASRYAVSIGLPPEPPA